jgi:hypothetical protein
MSWWQGTGGVPTERHESIRCSCPGLDTFFLFLPQFISPKTSLRKLKDLKKCEPGRHVLIITCPEDKSTWHVFTDQNLPLYSSELLLVGVLKQELELERYSLAFADYGLLEVA